MRGQTSRPPKGGGRIKIVFSFVGGTAVSEGKGQDTGRCEDLGMLRH